MIAIYQGEGVFLREHLPEATPITAAEIINRALDRFSVFIMPGGRDRLYQAALKGPGNAAIRKFVENGGLYLGLCAGAYYASAQVEFDQGFPLEVCEERELQFFKGKAIGPAFGKGTFAYNSEKGARLAQIETIKGIFSIYYNGGCFFQGDFSNVRILGRYLELPHTPPAIIECTVGKGRAILSGVHLELELVKKNPLAEMAESPSANEVKMKMEDRLACIGAVIR